VTGVCHHVVVPRRQRGADVSAAVRRAGSLNRGRNLRAGSGPPFPSPAFSPFVCVLLLPFLFFCSRSHQALGSTRKLRNICQKTPQKHQKKKKKKKSVNYINYYLFYYIAQNKHVKTTAREPQFEDLERDFSLRAQFSLICAFYSPFLPA
jgi:hypothetical protein